MIRLSIPSINNQEERAVRKVLKSGFLVQGKTVAAFEKKIANYLGVKHAIAVNSGTSALHLSLIAAGVGPKDEVILPDFTFPATANVVELVGAKPVVVDIDPFTFNIEPHLIEKAITKRTKAIMPVHLFGQSADMGPILKLARKYGLKIIEDAACVLGAEYRRQKCGTLGELGCFSFHPRKIITTGEGGIVVTKNGVLAEQLRSLRNHGIIYKNNKIDFVMPGFNYRMTEIQAAMGLIQMDKLEDSIRSRQRIADIYKVKLASIDWIKTPTTPSYNTHVYQTYVIQVNRGINRDKLIAYLRQQGIEANIGTYALHRLTFYKNKYRLKVSQFPVTEQIFKTAVSLPFFDHLSASQIQIIAGHMQRFQ